CPPHPAVSDIGRFHHQVARDLALQADTPVDLTRRTSRIPIDGNERRLRRPQAGGDFVRILLSEVREEDLRVAKPVACCEWISIRQGVFVQSISRNAERVEIGNASRQIPEIRRCPVNYSGTQTQHGLRVGTDLIRKCESWSERPGIVLVEAAFASGFVYHRAG